MLSGIFIKISCSILFSILLSVNMSCAGADDSTPRSSTKRPKIGLVLGGGGAKGFAHIGVLKMLEENMIPVDFIAGTSMGAVIGALYSAGYSAAQIENTVASIDWKAIFSGDPDRRNIAYRRKKEDYDILTKLRIGIKDGKLVMPRGLVKDQKVNMLFETLLLHTSGVNDFDGLPIRFRAVAADLETGELVILKNGRLADAARASMAVPGAFTPVEIDGRLLVDGGLVMNLPVDIVREMGADIIICVDVDKPLSKRDQLSSSLLIITQMFDIMMKKNVAEQIKKLTHDDIYINPELGEANSTDFRRSAEISLAGYKAAFVSIDKLRQYSVDSSEYEIFASRRSELLKEVQISSVKIEIQGDKNITPEMASNILSIKPGDTVDTERLKKESDLLYGTGDFERVTLSVNQQDSKYELSVKAKENMLGPNQLRFGLGLSSNMDGSSTYNILVDYTKRWINSFGAEWKTQLNLGTPSGIYSEFHQPLASDRLFFISPFVKWTKEPFDYYEGKRRTSSYTVSIYEAGLDFGIQPWTYGEVRTGIHYSSIRGKPRIGSLDLRNEKTTRGAFTLSGRLDQLDNVNFPNRGYLAQFNSIYALKSLGSDDEYNKIQASLLGAATFGRQTILALVSAGTHFGSDIPFYDKFRLGGFLNLSGLGRNQLHGQHMATGKLITYHKVSSSFVGDFYLGCSVETGSVWDDKGDAGLNRMQVAGSIFIGYDTIFGPLYLGFGHAERGYSAGYLFLGRPFLF
jgi:NTE family protein